MVSFTVLYYEQFILFFIYFIHSVFVFFVCQRIANSSMTSSFKTTPTILPNLGEVRPFPGRCCDCMPESKVGYSL